MIIDTAMARADWAARVSKQAEQMLAIAEATDDTDMRDELLCDAARLQDHALWIAVSGSRR
jgi:hypothetical protein